MESCITSSYRKNHNCYRIPIKSYTINVILLAWEFTQFIDVFINFVISLQSRSAYKQRSFLKGLKSNKKIISHLSSKTNPLILNKVKHTHSFGHSWNNSELLSGLWSRYTIVLKTNVSIYQHNTNMWERIIIIIMLFGFRHSYVQLAVDTLFWEHFSTSTAKQLVLFNFLRSTCVVAIILNAKLTLSVWYAFTRKPLNPFW